MANEGERPDSGWVIVQMMTASGSCASPGLENALFHGGSNGREEAGLKTCLEVPIATILARTSTGKSYVMYPHILRRPLKLTMMQGG